MMTIRKYHIAHIITEQAIPLHGPLNSPSPRGGRCYAVLHSRTNVNTCAQLVCWRPHLTPTSAADFPSAVSSQERKATRQQQAGLELFIDTELEHTGPADTYITYQPASTVSSAVAID